MPLCLLHFINSCFIFHLQQNVQPEKQIKILRTFNNLLDKKSLNNNNNDRLTAFDPGQPG